jgi:hypothetical protein
MLGGTQAQVNESRGLGGISKGLVAYALGSPANKQRKLVRTLGCDEDEAGAVGVRNINGVVTEISGVLIPLLVLG